MKFSIIGGDMRQAWLAKHLADDGNSVAVFGLDAEDGSAAIRRAESVSDAVKNSEYVILPLPAADGEGNINAPMFDGKIPAEEVLDAVTQSQTVFAGRIEGMLENAVKKRGLRAIDYFAREELAVKNAGATAEGAVQILLEEMPTVLTGARVLVVGFGRIGKLLSMKLRAMGADVTVSARRFSDFAWIEEMGYRSADTRRLAGNAGKFDAIVNTVPAGVIDDRVLEHVRKDCLMLDLASKPGGIDFDAAARRGIKVIWALSLPGKVAPETSGMAIRDTIYNIVKELECAD